MSAHRNYSVAVEQFQRARRELVERQVVVAKVADALKEPPTLCFSSTSVGVHILLGAPGVSENTASAQDWRTPDELQQLVNDYLTADGQMQVTWSAIPQLERSGMTPPEAIRRQNRKE